MSKPVNMKCLYCNDYRVRYKGKGKACDKFPGKQEDTNANTKQPD